MPLHQVCAKSFYPDKTVICKELRSWCHASVHGAIVGSAHCRRMISLQSSCWWLVRTMTALEGQKLPLQGLVELQGGPGLQLQLQSCHFIL